MRYAKADLALYFDFPKTLCFYRVLKRRFFKDHSIQDRADNCPEVISWKLLTYTWRFEPRVHNQLQTIKAQYPHVLFVEVHNDRELELIKLIYYHPFRLFRYRFPSNNESILS